jgi:ubiquinone biosynthesis monooxygenase Coq7
MSAMRRLDSPLDRLIAQLDHGLRTSLAPAAPPQHAYPAEQQADAELSEDERRHAAGLMRINHAGEVCAQALYLGQAVLARDAATRAHLLAAAREEADHLAWCARRLDELGSRPSRINPFWYAGSFAIGAVTAAVGDSVSLGFVVETERQVEAHLGDHLERLPRSDARSRAVVARMQADEARHGIEAQKAGASELPRPLPRAMAFAAGLMKRAAYRF